MKMGTVWGLLAYWIPSITVAAGVAVVGFIYREVVAKWLTQRISHHFSESLETLKSELRLSEQNIQAELQGKQKQIDALYGTTMSARAGRQSAIEKRRLEAIERVWKAAIRLSGMAATPKLLEPFNLDKVFKATGADADKRTQLFSVLDTTLGASKFLEAKELASVQEERPFVSPAVWAYYSAYNSIIMNAVLLVSIMSKGLFVEKYFNFQSVKDVVKKVLPHQASGIDEHGITYCYMCSQELLDALLAAVQGDLEGKAQDAAELRRCKELMDAVEQANSDMSKTIHHSEAKSHQ